MYVTKDTTVRSINTVHSGDRIRFPLVPAFHVHTARPGFKQGTGPDETGKWLMCSFRL